MTPSQSRILMLASCLMVILFVGSPSSVLSQVLEYNTFTTGSCTSGTAPLLSTKYDATGECIQFGTVNSYKATCSALTVYGTTDCSGSGATSNAGCIVVGNSATEVRCLSGNYFTIRFTGIAGTCTNDSKLPAGRIRDPGFALVGECATFGGTNSVRVTNATSTTAVATFFNSLNCAGLPQQPINIEFGKCFANPINQFPNVILASTTGSGAAGALGAAVFMTLLLSWSLIVV